MGGSAPPHGRFTKRIVPGKEGELENAAQRGPEGKAREDKERDRWRLEHRRTTVDTIRYSKKKGT